MLRQAGHVLPVDDDAPLVGGVDAGHQIQQGGLARPVAPDDGDEIPVLQGEVYPVESPLLIDGAGVEGLIDLIDFKHWQGLPSLRPW